MSHFPHLHVYLESQEESEEELVLLVQTSGGVVPHCLRQEIYDVFYSLENNVGRLGLGDQVIDESEEVLERNLTSILCLITAITKSSF